MPNLYIIAGCIGAGKTTASFTVLPDMLNCDEFIITVSANDSYTRNVMWDWSMNYEMSLEPIPIFGTFVRTIKL